MSENNNRNFNVNVEIPPSVDNAIQNLTDNPTKSIGKTFADIWYLVFGSISFNAEKKRLKYEHSLEQFRQELDASVSNIPPENRIEPSMQVTGQALNNSRYCIEEDELREMFVCLITNSMNSDYSEQVHPSYSEIIKQMSVLDARIIRLFKNTQMTETLPSFPVCQYCFNSSKDEIHYTPISEHIFLDFPDADIRLCSQSLSSLSRLGIVSISYTSVMKDLNTYDKFLQHPYYEEFKNRFSNSTHIIKKGAVALTPLGRSFVDVCIPN